MGADIHGAIQHRENDSWWSVMRLGLIDRDYRMFRSLAGVRGDGTAPVVMPRGVPSGWECWHEGECKDAEYHDCPLSPDSHHPTWLTLAEYSEALRRAENEEESPPEMLDDDWWAIEAVLTVYGEEGRVVLWFDN